MAFAGSHVGFLKASMWVSVGISVSVWLHEGFYCVLWGLNLNAKQVLQVAKDLARLGVLGSGCSVTRGRRASSGDHGLQGLQGRAGSNKEM